MSTDSGTRYNFIIPEDGGYDLELFRKGQIQDFSKLYAYGEYCWSLQTYKVLQDTGLNLSLSHQLDEGAINLAHVNMLRDVKPRWNCFLVSLQADYPACPLAQYHIVQNRDQEAADTTFIPLWPQIGQIPRDITREGINVVAYQGRIGFSDLNMERLEKDLDKHGIQFRALGENEWSDLSQVDVLVGIRSFSKKEYRRKPPSKLTNAWLAGIPFIGGWDSAFSQQGIPGEDYLRVSSYDELYDAIVRLKNDPQLFRTLIERGLNKAQSYSFEALASEWERVLTKEVADTYKQWVSLSNKRMLFGIKKTAYESSAASRSVLRSLYAIPGIQQLRERYFDPVK